MSDDFDKQDDDFDWLGDDGDDEENSSSDSGLTGQLSWLQDNDKSPDANKGRSQTDDLDLDWLNTGDEDSGAPPSADATGVTGELSWLSDQSFDDSPDASRSKGITDDLDWMKGDDDEPDDDVSVDNTSDSEPSWLSDTGSLLRDEDSENAPDWLENVGDTGMLNRDAINQTLDEIDDEEDQSPSWLKDTGTFDRTNIDSVLDSLDEEDDDEQPDWLTSMGIGESSNADDDFDDDDSASDWLSGISMGADADDDDDDVISGLANLFGDDDDNDEDDGPLQLDGLFAGSDADDDGDKPVTDLFEYVEDGDDDYDPYAIYGEEFEDDGDDEYEDIFNTDTLSSSGDTDDLGIGTSDTTLPDDSPDWLTEFDDTAFKRVTAPLGNLPTDTPDEDTGWLDDFDEDEFEHDTGMVAEESDDAVAEDDTGWLDEFDEDEFAGDTGTLTPEDDPIEETDTEWLDAFDEDEFENADFDEPESDPIYEVPDWLQGDDDSPQGETDFLASESPDDIPEMTADELLSNLGIDPDDRPSTGLTESLESVDDDFDLSMFDDEASDEPVSTGLTGDLAGIDDSLLDDLDFDDLELDVDRVGTGLTGELGNLDDDEFDLSFFDDLQPVDDSTGTGLTGELGDLTDDDLDMSFLDDVEVDDQPERMGTGLTGELGNLNDDLDMSFLDDVEVDEQPERMGTGLTGELGSFDDDDLDMSFLDDVEVDDQPERMGTGLTGELSDFDDDDLDMSFLDDVEIDDEPERIGTGLTGDLDSADDDMDLSFLDDVEEEATGFTGELESADEELDLSFLDDEDESLGDDWFAESTVDATDDEPDWMQTLADADVNAFEMQSADDDVDDIFDSLDLDDVDFSDFEAENEPIAPAADLSALLASYDDIEEGEFDIDNTDSGIDDLSAIFDAALQEDTVDDDDLPGDIPEWLRGIDVGDDETSAAAIIRQQEDKPLEDLDDRLQALRERGISAGAREETSTSPAPEVLAEVDNALIAPTIAHETEGIVSDITLTASQQKQAELLQKIVGVTITPTVETDESGVPMVESSRRRRSLPKIGLGRLAVALIILLVLILPFIANFSIGSLPPLAFGRDNPNANAVFAQIENLNSGDYVLVGFEYGPTAAGELDSVADILLRHIFSQGAVPIIVSSNPVGVVHAQNILRDIEQSVGQHGLVMTANQDYYVARYLTGGTLGLRDLSQNFESTVNINVKGEPTNLNLTSLNDMALMLLIAERADDIRNWSEQVAPSTSTNFVAATGYSAQPMAEPYVSQTEGILGLVIGYRDAYTYGEMLQAVYATPTLAPTETFTATFTVTNTPEPSATPQPTDTPEPDTAAPTEDSGPDGVTTTNITGTDGEDDEPTTEPTATNTPVPTDTPTTEPTATNTSVPTNTPTSTPTLSPTPRLITVIIVNSPQGSVNVRTGASVNFPVLTTVNDGDVFQVIGENEEGDWFNFLLPDGREGWIASFLVEQVDLPETDFEGEVQSDDSADAGTGVTVLQVSYRRRMGKNQVRFFQQQDPTETATVTGTPPTATPTFTPSQTFTPTTTPTATFTPSPTPDPRAGYVFSRDRRQEEPRLNAMTMGTIAAVILILFGNIYFGLQAIARRRRETKR